MQQPKSRNITWQAGVVSRADRERVRGHRGAALWFTGLSGSGKSTIAARVEHALLTQGCATYVLDGDNVRHGLCRDLGFSPEDRAENIRRIGEVAKLFVDANVLCMCAFISPYRAVRAQLRASLAPGDFVEIYVKASLLACERRDPKGLYKKAREGKISDMTGIGSPYEPPEDPELVLDTESSTPDESVQQVLGFLQKNGYIASQT
ncbi:MAG TPA: adenylyl-sulfate kinase [Polyangiales bacterium]|nr:adenylyl-sulfate kinase [Polyangiales bacterium]